MKKPMGRSVLGRGLEALIPTAPADPVLAAAPAGVAEIEVERIAPSAWQPRDVFDPEALAELAQSIKEQGVLQPVIVRPHRENYQLVAGERRWRAAQLAGLKRIPALVKTVAESRVLEIALVENLQRRDLSALETAKALRLLVDEHHLKQEDVAARVGMKRSSVANYLRLLTLAPAVREALADGRIEMGHAKALGALDETGQQVAALRTILATAASVRQAEQVVQRMKAGKGAPAPVPRKDANVGAAEKRLQAVLGAKVHIVSRGGGAGRIEILYRSEQELQRIFSLLVDDVSGHS